MEASLLEKTFSTFTIKFIYLPILLLQDQKGGKEDGESLR